jgi:solute carrier family 45, member 1/2/4
MVGAAGVAGVAPASIARRGTYFADAPSKIRGPPQLHLPLLTLGAFGFQLVWSMEMAFAGPFLTELGLSKSQVAAVLIAGPVSGLIVQPIIGGQSRGAHR